MDIYKSQSPSELYKARLAVLLENTNALYSSGSGTTEDTLASSYADAMKTFIRSLDSSIAKTLPKIYCGAPADPLRYNIVTSSILKDLTVLYDESNILDKMIASNFNAILTRKNQISQVSKRINDKLGTYLLYVDPNLGAGYFFGDTFNSAENLDIGSNLLDTDECYLGLDEGAILLPLDGDPVRPKIKSYVINSNSNGQSGNNHELNKIGHNTIEVIGDGEPNTWFEYEKVVSYESSSPLILDILISLSDLSIVNYLSINPINFGTAAPVKIRTLDTSPDGVTYISIKDEIPIKDFIPIDEDNTFDLCPASSKFSGKGAYSFLPRRVKFVHIVLEQYVPYVIETNNGQRLRYAIGIRDIDILSRKFKAEGSIISKQFSSSDAIRKVSIFTNENPIEKSDLADIEHFISEDDGGTWRGIQPLVRSDSLVPEIIEFNTTSESSIDTSGDVTALRHKIHIKRNKDAFVGDVVTKTETISKTEVITMPVGGDFSFTTSEEPIEETVSIVLPFYGSYSCPRDYSGTDVQGAPKLMDLDMFEFTIDSSVSSAEGSTDVMRFDLPYAGFENIHEHLRVFFEGSQIEYCAKDPSALGQVSGIHSMTSYAEVDSNSKVYFLDRNGQQLQFGYIDSAGTRCGFLPPGGAKIQVCLDGDNPRLELTDIGYVLALTHSSDGVKENVSIVSMDFLSESESVDYITPIATGRSKAQIRSRSSGVISKKNTTDLKFVGIPRLKVLGKDKILSSIEDINSSLVIEAKEGLAPPSFVNDPTTWTILEYNLDNALIPSASMYYTTLVDFIDGRQELLIWDSGTSTWVPNVHAYSFDYTSGRVYLGGPAPSDRKIFFKCKLVTSKIIEQDNWSFYKNKITGRIDVSKIVLNPKDVYTHKNTRAIEDFRTLAGIASYSSINSLCLLEEQSKKHDWFKQSLVKGTVLLDSSIFPNGTKPIEVDFIDGHTELSNIVQVVDEPITLTLSSGSLYTYTLGSINSNQILSGQPCFAAIRSLTSSLSPENLFATYTSSIPANHGEWTYTVASSGECTITIYLDSISTTEHTVAYQYKIVDPGVDMSGLYSIDYSTATIHFAEAITRDGNIQFETSAYSAFYNIGESVSDSNIESIDASNKKITLSHPYGMKLLKLSSVLKSRPEYAKIMYGYYKKTVESIKDLEPYFSPICKDIAFRAVTSNMLSEL